MSKEKGKAYQRKYRSAWESDSELKGWITSDTSGDGTKAFKLCKTSLAAHKKDLLLHKKSKKHQEAEKHHLAGPSKKITDFIRRSITTNRKIVELKVAAFICEHTSLSTVDHLGSLIKCLDHSSELLNDIKLHRTKCSALIFNVLSPCLLNELISDVGNSNYSLIIDESTAVDTTKMLCIMIKYFSIQKQKIVTAFYRLIEIQSGDAATISTAVVEQLKKDQLNIKKLTGIGVDGANVMVGPHNSLSSSLKAKNKELVVVRCICHSLHLAAEKAFRTLPSHIDFMIKECHNWFSNSTKRQIAYREIYKTIADKNPLKIDKLAGTRWLSRYNAIVKIIDQWDALKLHFDLARSSEKCYMAEQLFLMLLDRKNFLYFNFLSWALEDVTQINALFQSDNVEPLKLMEDLNLLFFNKLGILIPPVTLNKVSKQDLINFKFEDYVIDDSLINFGYTFNKIAANIDQESLSVIRANCKNFIVELCKEIKERIPENINLLIKLNSFTPELAISKIRQPDITEVAASFTTLCEDVNKTVREWTAIPGVNWANLDNTEKFWNEVAHNVGADGELRFKRISSLALGLLSLPYSNASVERAFSIINIIKNKLRNRLAISSAESIMRVRCHLNKLGGCISFEPSEAMLKLFNSENMYQCKEDDALIIDAFSDI